MDAKTALARKLDLTHRPRRNRRTDWSRRLVRENVVTTNVFASCAKTS